MIFVNSLVATADNTGVKKSKCIHIYRNKLGLTGFVCLVVLRKNVLTKKLKAGDKMKALLVSTSKLYRRKTGSVFIRARRTKIVLLKKNDPLPFANRIFARLFKEIRFYGFLRIAFISRGLF